MAKIVKAASGTPIYLHFLVILYCSDLLPLQGFSWIPIFLPRGDFHMTTRHSFIISFLLSWDQFLLKAILFEKWKMETLKNKFNLFADTRHNYPWGNKAPILWPRLTIEMELLLAPKEHDFQTQALCSCHCCDESNQWTVEAPGNSKEKHIKFFIKTGSQIIILVSGQPHHSSKYCFHSRVRKYGRVLDEKLGNVNFYFWCYYLTGYVTLGKSLYLPP